MILDDIKNLIKDRSITLTQGETLYSLQRFAGNKRNHSPSQDLSGQSHSESKNTMFTITFLERTPGGVTGARKLREMYSGFFKLDTRNSNNPIIVHSELGRPNQLLIEVNAESPEGTLYMQSLTNLTDKIRVLGASR